MRTKKVEGKKREERGNGDQTLFPSWRGRARSSSEASSLCMLLDEQLFSDAWPDHISYTLEAA